MILEAENGKRRKFIFKPEISENNAMDELNSFALSIK